MADYLEQRFDFHDPDVVAIFDELSLWSARFGTLLLDNLDLMPGIHGLDVGCGFGFPLLELAQIHGDSCHFTGVDTWQEALDRAELKRRIYNLTNIRLIKTDGRTIPLPDKSFDLIVSNLGINNFTDPEAVLAECARVAKPEARLALTTNIVGHFREFYELFREVVTEQAGAGALERLSANENHRGTRQSVCSLIEHAGFRVTKVIEDSFLLRFMDGSALLRHFLVKVGFLDGWRAVVGPSLEQAIFTEVEARLNQMARAHGPLTMTVPMLYVEGRRR